MADNVDVSPGSGKTIRTDEDGSGYQWQCIKVGLGGDGTMVFWSPGAGAVDTGTPRVTLASDDPAVAKLGEIDTAVDSMAVDVAAILADTAILSAWDETGRVAANLISGQAGVAAGAGAVSANTQRVTLASDDPLVVTQTSDTGAASQVADTNSDTTILAANADRRGAAITNDSSAILYLLVAAGTASSTNYTVALYQGDYYEVPAGYTGIIKGIWATDPGDGAARVTEWDNA